MITISIIIIIVVFFGGAFLLEGPISPTSSFQQRGLAGQRGRSDVPAPAGFPRSVKIGAFPSFPFLLFGVLR